MKLHIQMFATRLRRFLDVSALAVIVASCVLINHASAANEQEQEKQSQVTQQVYLLVCPGDESVWNLPPQGLHWKTLHKMLDEKAAQLIEITDRDEVDQSLYVDVEGLRLYASSRDCLKAFKQLSPESSQRITLAYLVRSLLNRRYSETGIQPDRIPVKGEAGKKLGVEGMVRLKGSEYVRRGHYFTSQSAELAERTGDNYKVKVAAFYIDKYKVTNEEFQQAWSKHLGKPVVEANSIGMKMILIPPGEFMMGTAEADMQRELEQLKAEESQWYKGSASGRSIETPLHRVRLTKPYYLGATEVTVGQFREFVEATGYKTEAERGSCMEIRPIQRICVPGRSTCSSRPTSTPCCSCVSVTARSSVSG